MAGSGEVEVAVERLVALGAPEKVAQSVVGHWVERDEQVDPGALIAVVQGAAEAGAPVELVLDKATEGLAKGVPRDRLLRVLEDWGKDLGQAAQLAQVLRRELDPGGVSERETVLRLGILQRTRKDSGWLLRLEEKARRKQVDVPGFLRIGEAVGQLARLGLEEREAEELGVLWMERGVPAREVGKFVRAIEVGRDWMPVSQAAKSVTEGMLQGRSSDEILGGMEKEREKREKDEARSPLSLERGRKKTPEQTPAEERHSRDKERGSKDKERGSKKGKN